MLTKRQSQPREPTDRPASSVFEEMETGLREFAGKLSAGLQKLERHGLALKANTPTVVYETEENRYILTRVPTDEHRALTPREAKIAELVSEGRSNPEIADELQIRRPTVAAFVRRILKKTGARNRIEITRFMLCADLRNRGAVRQPEPTTGGA